MKRIAGKPSAWKLIWSPPRPNRSVRQIWRNDRFGRGGDHTEFLNLGFPAVRFTVAVENYNWQHQDLRTENGIKYGDMIENMDFPYLEKITKLNVAALAGIASAPPPPEPTVEGGVSTNTRIGWHAMAGASSYVIRWRRTDANQWQEQRTQLNTLCPSIATGRGGEVRGDPMLISCDVTLDGVRVDDWVFGVSSVGADGFESPVASAVPGGAFRPYVAPPPEPVK